MEAFKAKIIGKKSWQDLVEEANADHSKESTDNSSSNAADHNAATSTEPRSKKEKFFLLWHRLKGKMESIGKGRVKEANVDPAQESEGKLVSDNAINRNTETIRRTLTEGISVVEQRVSSVSQRISGCAQGAKVFLIWHRLTAILSGAAAFALSTIVPDTWGWAFHSALLVHYSLLWILGHGPFLIPLWERIGYSPPMHERWAIWSLFGPLIIIPCDLWLLFRSATSFVPAHSMLAQLEEQRFLLGSLFLSPCCIYAAITIILEGSSSIAVAYFCALVAFVDVSRMCPFIVGVCRTASALEVGSSQVTWELFTRPSKDSKAKEGAEPLCLRAKCGHSKAIDFRLVPESLRQLDVSQIRELHRITEAIDTLRCLTFGSCNMLKAPAVEELSGLLRHRPGIRCRIEGPLDFTAQSLTDENLNGWLTDFVNAGAELDVLVLSENPALTFSELWKFAATLESQYENFVDRGADGVRFVRMHKKYLPLHSLRQDTDVSLSREDIWELSTQDMAFIDYHVTQNTNLKRLELGCMVPKEATMKLLESCLMRSNDLHSFALRSSPLPLREIRQLQYVTLSSLNIGDEDVRLVAALACKNTLLEDLDLRNNRIGDLGLTSLGYKLPYMTKLKNLKLSGNAFGYKGLHALFASYGLDADAQDDETTSSHSQHSDRSVYEGGSSSTVHRAHCATSKIKIQWKLHLDHIPELPPGFWVNPPPDQCPSLPHLCQTLAGRVGFAGGSASLGPGPGKVLTSTSKRRLALGPYWDLCGQLDFRAEVQFARLRGADGLPADPLCATIFVGDWTANKGFFVKIDGQTKTIQAYKGRDGPLLGQYPPPDESGIVADALSDSSIRLFFQLDRSGRQMSISSGRGSPPILEASTTADMAAVPAIFIEVDGLFHWRMQRIGADPPAAGSNCWTDDAVRYVTSLIAKNTNVTSAQIRNVDYPADVLRKRNIVKMSPLDREAHSFSPLQKQLTDFDGQIIADFLSENTVLERLDLSGNALGEKSALRLSLLFFQGTCPLRFIDLRGNTGIGAAEIRTLAVALQRSGKITLVLSKIELGCNPSDQSAVVLTDEDEPWISALLLHTIFATCELHGNQFSTQCVAKLLDALCNGALVDKLLSGKIVEFPEAVRATFRLGRRIFDLYTLLVAKNVDLMCAAKPTPPLQYDSSRAGVFPDPDDIDTWICGRVLQDSPNAEIVLAGEVLRTDEQVQEFCRKMQQAKGPIAELSLASDAVRGAATLDAAVTLLSDPRAPQLRALKLGHLKIGPYGEDLGYLLQSLKSLVSALQQAKILFDQISYVGTMLPVHPDIISILREEFAPALADYFERNANPSLKVILNAGTPGILLPKVMASAIIKLQHRHMNDVEAAFVSVLLTRGTTIKAIWLDGNDLSLDGFAFFLHTLDSPNLKALTLSSERSINLDEMRDATGYHLCGETVAEEYQLRDPEMLVIAALVRTSTCLEVLDLRENEITDWGAQRLIDAIKCCKTLTSLDLRRNRISIKCRKLLYRLVQGTSTIKELLVMPQKDDEGEEDNLDDDDDDDELNAALGRPKKKGMDFEHIKTGRIIELNNLRETLDMSLVCELLDENINCHTFEIIRNNVGDAGASEFADSFLKWSPSLCKLYLNHCEIGDVGAVSIGKSLAENTDLHLEELCLWSNSIGDDGAVALADWLRIDETVIELQLFDNEIGDVGCAALCEALCGHPTIERLAIGQNRFTEAALEHIVELLEENEYVEVFLDDDDFPAEVKRKTWMQLKKGGGDATERLQF